MTLSANEAALVAAAGVATSAGETITLNLQRLLYEIETQATQFFKGGGGTAFQNASALIGEDLKDMLQGLNRLAENVRGSSVLFGTTDQAAEDMINRVAANAGTGYGNIAAGLNEGGEGEVR